MSLSNFKILVAVVGTAATGYLGGWDAALQFFVYALIADYITGVLAAWQQKRLNSEIMFWGGIRKGLVLGVIGLAVALDKFTGNPTPIFRTLALYYYIGREALSIVENLGLLGIPIPPGIANRLTQLGGGETQPTVTPGQDSQHPQAPPAGPSGP